MQAQPTTAAIILAAGSSSRMGGERHKLLLPLGNRPVLVHVIDTVLASQARPVVIVLGHRADEVRTHLTAYENHSAITMVENFDYAKGMSTSLRVGLQTLLNQQDNNESVKLDSALLLLGDQPLMTPQIIDTLIATRQATEKSIIAPLYGGQQGNPMLFEASLFAELMRITGDQGGRRVIEKHQQEIATVEFGETMSVFDVDTWDAYQQVIEEWERKHEH